MVQISVVLVSLFPIHVQMQSTPLLDAMHNLELNYVRGFRGPTMGCKTSYIFVWGYLIYMKMSKVTHLETKIHMFLNCILLAITNIYVKKKYWPRFKWPGFISRYHVSGNNIVKCDCNFTSSSNRLSSR